MSRTGRTRWIALGLLALGLVGPAASAFEAPAACCPEMAAAGEPPCAGLVAVSCCEAGVALGAHAPAPGARCEVTLPTRGGERLPPLLLERGARSAAKPIARTRLASSVLRL